jgi:uncharacterized membrane protein HdeD (DUF308 family)
MAEGTHTAERLHLYGFEELQRKWGWFLAVGIGLIILGAVAIASAATTTVVSLVTFGWLLLIGAVMEIAYGISSGTWSGFFVDLIVGVLYGVAGFLVVMNPAASAVTLTLLIAMLLIVVGIFRIVAAIAARYPSWGWLALHGLISVLLGVLIWQQWPVSGFWVIGLFIGIELIVNGAALAMLSLAARQLQRVMK